MNVQTFAEQIALVQYHAREREKELLELLRRCAIKLDDISKGYSNLVELDILPKQHHPTAQMIILDIEELQRKLTKELADAVGSQDG